MPLPSESNQYQEHTRTTWPVASSGFCETYNIRPKNKSHVCLAEANLMLICKGLTLHSVLFKLPFASWDAKKQLVLSFEVIINLYFTLWCHICHYDHPNHCHPDHQHHDSRHHQHFNQHELMGMCTVHTCSSSQLILVSTRVRLHCTCIPSQTYPPSSSTS